MSELQQWSVKHRPQGLEAFMGDDDLKTRIAAVIKNRRQHALLITGPTGCGKTTLGKLIGYGVARVPYGVNTTDVAEYNMGDKRGIDDVRRIVELSRLLPNRVGGRRVFILDEVHALTGPSASALLKPLEEPADHVTWILATDQPERLLPTIVNRCYPLRVDLADPTRLQRYLLGVLKAEAALREWSREDRIKLVKAITLAAGQIPRAALQMLQGAVDSAGDYAGVDALLAGPVLGSPQLDLDKAAINIMVSLLLRWHTGRNTAPYVFTALNSQDGYALLRRLLSITQAAYMELATDERQPAAWYFFKRCSEIFTKQAIKERPSQAALGALLCGLVEAQATIGDFTVDPKTVLTAKLIELHREMKRG